MSLQDRYSTIMQHRQLPNGRLVYRSLLPTTISTDVLSDSHIEATDTLRMDRLAANVYGDPLDWWRLAAVNGRFHGSMFFKPGFTIIISAE